MYVFGSWLFGRLGGEMIGFGLSQTGGNRENVGRIQF